jgi:hypothetical protein
MTRDDLVARVRSASLEAMKLALYLAACLLGPPAWGVAMYFAFGLVDRRRRRAATEQALPPIDYAI